MLAIKAYADDLRRRVAFLQKLGLKTDVALAQQEALDLAELLGALSELVKTNAAHLVALQSAILSLKSQVEQHGQT